MFGAEITQVAELTDAIIKDKLQEISGLSKSVSIEAAFADVDRNVKLLMNQMLDIEYSDCPHYTLSFPKNEVGSSLKVTKGDNIISVLQPPRLKDRVEDALQA